MAVEQKSPSRRICLVVLIIAFLLFIGYLGSRDSVIDYANLSPIEVRSIVRQAEEWCSPKFFRHIEIRPDSNGNVTGWIRESRDNWSVTTFTNAAGQWKKTGWLVVQRTSR